MCMCLTKPTIFLSQICVYSCGSETLCLALNGVLSLHSPLRISLRTCCKTKQGQTVS